MLDLSHKNFWYRVCRFTCFPLFVLAICVKKLKLPTRSTSSSFFFFSFTLSDHHHHRWFTIIISLLSIHILQISQVLRSSSSLNYLISFFHYWTAWPLYTPFFHLSIFGYSLLMFYFSCFYEFWVDRIRNKFFSISNVYFKNPFEILAWLIE